MKFVITVDTEEDNWDRYHTTDNPLKNIERVVFLQQLLDEFGVRPTYLVTYPVVTAPRSVEILKRILDRGKCEIGMHCHPWNTPPFDKNEVIRKHNTMLCNLPETQQLEKLATLHEAICKNFGITPVVFRAGRWGFGPGLPRAISQLGYRIDTSVTPYMNWAHYHGPDFSDYDPAPFRFTPLGLEQRDAAGSLLEVPVTIGFLQSNFQVCNRFLKALEHPLARCVHATGLFYYLKLINKTWLSPETSDAASMIRLAICMQRNNYPILNMVFHSSSLMKGLSPFVRSDRDEDQLLQNIREFLEFSQSAGWQPTTLGEFEAVNRRLNHPSPADHSGADEPPIEQDAFECVRGKEKSSLWKF